MIALENLRCEYRIDPVGIDTLKPRFSWELRSEKRGARQTAYHVTATRAVAPHNDTAPLWDSGRIESDQSVGVVYEGSLLESGTRVVWRVRVWDETGEMAEGLGTFVLGLLERDEWIGQWIGTMLVGGPQTSVPCPYLRKVITLGKPVASAQLYVTALGLYEFYINGVKMENHALTPGYTDYRRRIPYQVYDFTSAVHEGENVLAALLGDGWYCGHIAENGRQVYGDRPRLLAQLVVGYDDGTRETFITDKSWRWTTGALLEADLLMGESYDARLEPQGWLHVGYDDSAWLPVVVFEDPGVAFVAPKHERVRPMERLEPIAPPTPGAHQWGKESYLYDFGQNMVGRVHLHVRGTAGATITMRHAEMLDSDGQLYTVNLRFARATDYYTLRGDGDEHYTPRFTFHGFRYVEISYPAGSVTIEAIHGEVLHTQMTPTGTFICSDPLINQLQHNIQWAQKGNFLEIPTDCPQRSERLGWTGDAQVFARTAAFNFDVAAFFAKWAQDVADAQTERGSIPSFAPITDPTSRDGGPAWSDAVVICPWTMYLCYADEGILHDNYAVLQRYIDYLETISPDFIRSHPARDPWGGYGDWLSINADTPKDLIGTAFLAYSAHLMAQIAARVGTADEVARYQALYEHARAAFQRRFLTSDGLLTGGTQTAYVLALHFDLLPEAQRANALNALVRDIEMRGMHLSTGFVGTPYLLHVLSDGGRLDIAYALLEQKSFPSWLYPVTQGATTIWERWDGWTNEKGFQNPGMNSFNHYAYGAVGAWLYQVVAGIDLDPHEPGYKHIVLRPRPGGSLTSASAALRSVYGEIASTWTKDDGRLTWRAVVPPNTRATAYIPALPGADISESGTALDEAAGVTIVRHEADSLVVSLEPGDYRFEVRQGGS